ncbi:hypothetical protein SPRG_20185 [Saprolegnia parasitica CBS 223.65]|uniref:Uncharacterized protein n=1 Tax=Saprolegnia parasitica (strain CBS 223.65) TaxID=695850 RepID=A0A067CB73_SAPPC|nr:hypothetical protein SPRG_20185 [Saprolegnia parasitica CBS 223.65]KDO28024.1 hypothetical protein SPRG_20185 [Saprolegnia parasitica CBS 223.65]|eukprot:XP_012201179.1 hypothetical protein SPRG_20185 [Saprolegnia parasitica CBS 223.65]
MYLLVASAEAAEPRAPGGLSMAAYNEASRRRQRLVDDRVTLAVMGECTAIKGHIAHFAKQYLLSALDPRLHDDLIGLRTAFEIWEMLRTRSRIGRGVGSADLLGTFDQVAMLKYIRREAATHFFARYEASIDRFLRPLLATSGHGAIAQARKAMADSAKAAFLAHAFAPHLTHEFESWQIANPTGGYDYLKACVQKQLANLPDDAFSLQKSVLGLQPAVHSSCGYCHSKGHIDSVCRHLFHAHRLRIVRDGYVLPHDAEWPQDEDDTLVDTSRRFCTYCQSTKHRDKKCSQLATDKQRGRVRLTYRSVAPPSESSVPIARFCTYCDSMYHHDSACSKLADAIAAGTVRAGYVFMEGNDAAPNENALLDAERRRYSKKARREAAYDE